MICLHVMVTAAGASQIKEQLLDQPPYRGVIIEQVLLHRIAFPVRELHMLAVGHLRI